MIDRIVFNCRTSLLMKNDFKEQDSKVEDWGQPPSPLTSENRQKAFKAQLILGIVSLIFIALPGVLFWFFGR